MRAGSSVGRATDAVCRQFNSVLAHHNAVWAGDYSDGLLESPPTRVVGHLSVLVDANRGRLRRKINRSDTHGEKLTLSKISGHSGLGMVSFLLVISQIRSFALVVKTRCVSHPWLNAARALSRHRSFSEKTSRAEGVTIRQRLDAWEPGSRTMTLSTLRPWKRLPGVFFCNSAWAMRNALEGS